MTKTLIATMASLCMTTTLIAGLANSPWPMVQGGAQHLGRADVEGPRFLNTVVYQWDGGGRITPPTIGEDGIYFTTGQYEGSGNSYLVAVDRELNERWRYTNDNNDMATRDVLTTVPAVNDSGRIYFNSYYGSPSPYTHVYMVDEDGSYVGAWGATANYVQSAPAIDEDGNVYWCRGNARGLMKNTSSFYAGSDDYIGGAPALSEDGSAVYAGTNGGDGIRPLYAVNTSDMSEKWRVDKGTQGGAPLVDGNTIYVPGNSELYAIRDDGSAGTELWNRTDIDAPSTVYGGLALGTNGVLYSGENDNGTLYALDTSDGSDMWTLDFGTGKVTAPVIDGDGMLYVGFNDSIMKIEDLGTSGSVLWSLDVIGNVQGLALGDGLPGMGSGFLYATTSDGYLYQIGIPEPCTITLFGLAAASGLIMRRRRDHRSEQ
ncbi:MAG: PQQ-binding-like beta-propeller repeat protein [Candidatus Pacebacteria bacterium]|nr:PQQ-binding-like beta-propeller repeat protein [Candidatus Paceibacterota bacterium]